MASRGIMMNMGAVILLVAMLWSRAMAQSSSSCTNVIIGLVPCLSFVSGSSSTPSSSCCTQLANVVQTQPRCLCTVLNGGGASLGVSINQTLALALPDACKVKTPPVSRCNEGANGPVSDSPAGLPENSSNGLNIGRTLHLVLFAMLVASCGSTFSSFF